MPFNIILTYSDKSRVNALRRLLVSFIDTRKFFSWGIFGKYLLRKSLNLPMFSDKLAMQKWMSGIETGDLSRFTDSALRNLTHGLITWKAQLSRVPIGQISKFVSVTFKTFLLQSKANSLYTIETSLWLDVSYRRHFRLLQHKFANRILL